MWDGPLVCPIFVISHPRRSENLIICSLCKLMVLRNCRQCLPYEKTLRKVKSQDNGGSMKQKAKRDVRNVK